MATGSQVEINLYFDVSLLGTYTTLEEVQNYLQDAMKSYGAGLGGSKFTTNSCKWTPHN